MVGERKGRKDAEFQSSRPKRRRPNTQDPQSGEPSSTPARSSARLVSKPRAFQSRATRSSPRLATKPQAPANNESRVKWQTELPNTAAALDHALLQIKSRRSVETRDLCDEISDCLTQSFFEDLWRCKTEQILHQENGSCQPVGIASKSAPTQRRDHETKAVDVKDADVAETTEPLPQCVVLDTIEIDLDMSTPSGRSLEKRRKQKRARKLEDRNNRKGGDKKRLRPTEARKTIQSQIGKKVDADLVAPEFPDRNGGHIEEVVEIEEAFVDGGFAPGRRKKKHRNNKLMGSVEEQVLDRSDFKSMANPEVKDVTPCKGMTPRLPWWRVSEDGLSTNSKSEKELLQRYVTAIIRTCVRESWNAETLRESYSRDPASSRGQAFNAVHASLRLLERARHMKECEARWRPELLRELLERQEIDWSTLKHDKKFDQFAGCDACLGHRRATARISLKGKRYDSADFWPGTSRFQVLSAEQMSERKLSVTVELRNGTTNDHLINIGADENDTEFWVDTHCLRKCLLFHELVHSTATIARDIRGVIERELGHGTVELKLSSKQSKRDGGSTSERLERFLVRSVLHDREYVSNHVTHLLDIIRLGDVYFLSPDAEVLDSGNPGKSSYVPTIYDAPLELGDEEYRQRIDAVVARSRMKKQAKRQSQ